MTTYYSKGVLSYDEELNSKIKRDSIPNWWYQDDYDRKIDFDNGFTGYVNEEGRVFDISHILWAEYSSPNLICHVFLEIR